MKSFEIEIRLNGLVQTGQVVVQDDGTINSEDAEEGFGKLLRRSKDFLIADAEEQLISDLTKEQENKLKDIHAKNYSGTDDNMSDEYESWLMSLTYAELISYLK